MFVCKHFQLEFAGKWKTSHFPVGLARMGLRIFCGRFLAVLLLLTTQLAATNCQLFGKRRAVIEDMTDIKEFKKLLRTKNNVLVMFVEDAKLYTLELHAFREAAEVVKDIGTLVVIQCDASPARKKLCKKLKISLTGNYVVKHYYTNEFHKDYDRKLTVNSLMYFMRDPTADRPWEEEPSSKDVLHFIDKNVFERYITKSKKPMMVMFYAPWCGFCKRLKPYFEAAATEVKKQGKGILMAMDVQRPETIEIRKTFDIIGLPTLIYIAPHDDMRYVYEGEAKDGIIATEGIIAFMQDPEADMAKPKKEKEPEWSADPNSDVVHLTDRNFDDTLKREKSALVMFYAPWCGHCKTLKPEYEKAAAIVKDKEIAGIMAAADASKEGLIAKRYELKAYPTLKYFVNGEFKYNVLLRDTDNLVKFMRNPKAPAPPPPPEKPWEGQEGNEHIVFLNDEKFSRMLRLKRYAFVFFYAPRCGYCKSTRPEFALAAKVYENNTRVMFGAVDCTVHEALCKAQNVEVYPLIRYYSNLKTTLPFTGHRTYEEFVAYMNRMISQDKRQEL